MAFVRNGVRQINRVDGAQELFVGLLPATRFQRDQNEVVQGVRRIGCYRASLIGPWNAQIDAANAAQELLVESRDEGLRDEKRRVLELRFNQPVGRLLDRRAGLVKKILAASVSTTKGEGVMRGQMLEPQIRILTARRVPATTLPKPATK